MTQDQENAALGGLVLKYQENERSICALRAALQEAAEGLTSHPPVLNVGADVLEDHVRDMKAALVKKAQIEPQLESAGLGNLINRGGRREWSFAKPLA